MTGVACRSTPGSGGLWRRRWLSFFSVLEGLLGSPSFSPCSLLNKVDKDAGLGAGKQGRRALVSWLSGFTAWDLRHPNES